MFDVELMFSLANVGLKVTSKDGTVIRRVSVTLDREFDDEIAAGLGGDAKKILRLLRDNSVDKAVFDIGEIQAAGTVTGMLSGEEVSIGAIWGDKATGKRGKEDEDPVSVRLEMACHHDDRFWSFLGRNGGGMVRVTFKRLQLRAPLPQKVFDADADEDADA